jgi:hypothetical protein
MIRPRVALCIARSGAYRKRSPALSDSVIPGQRYELNVGLWLEEHRDWVLQIGPDGYGYEARRRDEVGRGTGTPVFNLTLDGLHADVAALGTPS